MCHNNQYLTLSESDRCQITYCKSCRTFSVVYKSCCASFTGPELEQFTDIIKSLTEEDFIYDFMGYQMAIVKNPYAYIGFCLTPDDVDYLIHAIQEAYVLFDAIQIISS